MELYQTPEEYTRVIHSIDPHTQIWLTVTEFRGVEYLSIRKYYQDFDEEWKPTPEGINMPIDFNNSRELFTGLVEILSLAEARESVAKHFSEILKIVFDSDG